MLFEGDSIGSLGHEGFWGMRVGIVGMHYSPEPSGNAPYTTGLAAGLAARGHEVRVVTGIPHYPEWSVYEGYGDWRSDSSEGGVNVRRMRHYVPSRPTNVKRLLMEATFGVRAAVHGTWGKPDVVLAVSPALFSTALAVARLKAARRRPALGLWVQDVYSVGLVETSGTNGSVAGAAARFESAVMRAADGVAVIHDRFRRRLVEDLAVPSDQVRVIRNWTHLEPAPGESKASMRRRLGWPEGEIIALHAGNMGVKQGLENVVEAARLADERRSPVRFVLLGGGNQRPRLEQLGRDVQRLQFVPSLPGAEFQQALAAADVLLVNELPGLGEMSVPSKLTSYMTSGRPIVAATHGESVTASEVLTAGAGVVLPPGNPGALLEGVLRLGGDKASAAALGEAGIRYCQRILSKDAAIDSFEGWLGQLSISQSERIGERA